MFAPPLSWHVLSYLLLIPDLSSNLQHTRKHLLFYPHFLARKILILSTTVLLWVFLFLSILNVFNNHSAWKNYTTNPNKIISLFIILRPVVVNWKSCTAILQFAWNSRHLARFLVALKHFEIHVTISPKQRIKHRRMFYCIFVFPVCLYILRYVLFGLMMHKLKQNVPVGILNPHNKPSVSTIQIIEETTYGIISGLGAFLALCINVQMAFYASVLKEYCVCLNKRLADLRDRVMKQDLCFKYKPFQTELHDLRAMFEGLIDLHRHFESIFGLQILAGIINHALVTFSSIAAFFQTNNQPAEWFIFHGSSCVSFVYTLLLLSIFPIYLHDQSIQTAETVQNLMYHYQLMNSRNCYDAHTGFPRGTESSVADFCALYSFMQRAVMKPLMVSASGFAELTRSCLISIAALVIGFALFLLEQYESNINRWRCLNGTQAGQNPIVPYSPHGDASAEDLHVDSQYFLSNDSVHLY